LKAIVFDLFRTLVDPESVHPLAYKRTDRMAKVLGIDPLKLHQWWVNPQVRKERNLYRVPTLKDRLLEYCERTLNQPKEPTLVDRALYEADRYHDEAILHPHPEVLERLNSLRKKKIKIGVLSNCDEHEVQYWSRSPIAQLVDAAYFSIDNGCMKPDPALYLSILEKLGTPSPSESIFVGDGESEELRGSKSLGFGLVVFFRQYVANTGFHSADKLAEFEREADKTVDDIRVVTLLV
jgi:putative hydrolase of the HAD superfamily